LQKHYLISKTDVFNLPMQPGLYLRQRCRLALMDGACQDFRQDNSHWILRAGCHSAARETGLTRNGLTQLRRAQIDAAASLTRQHIIYRCLPMLLINFFDYHV
jgi:hypothetical protein